MPHLGHLISGDYMKVLVRNNTEVNDVLDDSEFINVALDQISAVALELKGVDEAERVLNGFSIVLELMQEVLIKKNINPINAVQHAEAMRQEHGTFSDKKFISTDEGKE